MGIFNQQPNYNESYSKEKRGITSSQGPPGPPSPAGAQGNQGPKGDQGIQGPKGDQGATGASGTGFNLTSRGDYNMLDKQLKGMANGTSFTDAVTKQQLLRPGFSRISSNNASREIERFLYSVICLN